VKVGAENCIMWSCKVCTLHQICIIRIMKSRRMRSAGQIARIWDIRNAYKILVEKREGKRPF
jgi:hypothetical protein